jgi:hypothetical protein
MADPGGGDSAARRQVVDAISAKSPDAADKNAVYFGVIVDRPSLLDLKSPD